MKIEDLERLLIDTLRDSLTSLKTELGLTKEFIYVDYPRMDATMPRISLTLTGSIQTPAGIGANVNTGSTLGIYEESTFDIDVWVHRVNKVTTSTPKRAGTALRDYISDEIVDVLLAQRTVLKTSDDILDIEKIGETPHPYDEDLELFRKTITIKVTHLRSY